MVPQKVEITYKTIIFTVLFLLSLALVWSIREIIILFFVSFVLMEALNPTVIKLEKLKIPRPLAIFIIYLVIIAVFTFTIAGVIPILVDQTSDLIRVLPSALEHFSFYGLSAIDISSQLKILETIPAEVAKTAVSLVSNIFSGLVLLVVTFYLLLERRHFDKYSLKITGGAKGQALFNRTFDQLETRLSSWVNGELLLMTIIGILSYVGYLILGLPYAVPLSLIAGLLEIVPNIGPIITTAIAGLVGLTISPITALFAIIWGIFVHQAENNFITPKIMKETVGINPIITILIIAAGAKLGGIGGALLAIPAYLTIATIVSVILSNKTNTSK
jgi:predicted PurR-regulated permease PerM